LPRSASSVRTGHWRKWRAKPIACSCGRSRRSNRCGQADDHDAYQRDMLTRGAQALGLGAARLVILVG
jgi:hypothetical protein